MRGFQQRACELSSLMLIRTLPSPKGCFLIYTHLLFAGSETHGSNGVCMCVCVCLCVRERAVLRA